MKDTLLQDCIVGLSYAFNVAKSEGKGEGLFPYTVGAVLRNEGVEEDSVPAVIDVLIERNVIHKAFYPLKAPKVVNGKLVSKGVIYFSGPSTGDSSSQAKFLRPKS